MKKYLICLLFVLLIGCSTTQEIITPTDKITTPDSEALILKEKTLKRKVAIVRFTNESKYAKGYFYDKDNDPLGKQVVDILSAKLAMSDKFILLERNDIEFLINESTFEDVTFQKVGADYIIVGSLTEFGRKNIGDVNLFSRTKSQIVYAAVNLRLIDVSTGQIIYSEEGKGQAETSTTTVMGLGETADYDATLNDRAISAAISKLVENIIKNCMDRPWKSYLLSKDGDNYIISGGGAQGISLNDRFEIVKKGERIKNPQTGMFIDLPGKVVGELKITYMGGDVPESEYSLAKLVNGKVDGAFNQYFIREKENE